MSSYENSILYANEANVPHSQCKRSFPTAGNQRSSHFQIQYLHEKKRDLLELKITEVLSESFQRQVNLGVLNKRRGTKSHTMEPEMRLI